jgi:hypothetical protein
MATLYGDQYAAAYVTKPSSKIGPGDVIGDVKRLYFEYTITAAPTAADVIKVAKLPIGARVFGAGLKFTDLGTTGVLELGWAASASGAQGTAETASASGLLLTVDVNTAADFVTMDQQQEAGGSLAGHLKKFTATVDVQILVTTAWTVTSGTIKGYVDYIVD